MIYVLLNKHFPALVENRRVIFSFWYFDNIVSSSSSPLSSLMHTECFCSSLSLKALYPLFHLSAQLPSEVGSIIIFIVQIGKLSQDLNTCYLSPHPTLLPRSCCHRFGRARTNHLKSNSDECKVSYLGSPQIH